MEITSGTKPPQLRETVEEAAPNLFARLVRPHPNITDDGERARSRLVATILLITVVVGSLVILGTIIASPEGIADPDTVAAALGAVALTLVFGINRAGYTNTAVMLMIAVLWIVFTIPSFMEGASATFIYYTIIPILLTAIFYSGRHVLAVTLSIAVATLVFTRFTSLHGPDDIRWFLQFLAIASAVAYALSYHYRTRERIIREQFQKINDELNAGSLLLEQKVEERTRDLATAAAVNAQISTILDTNRLLQDVVDLTKERFRLYHAHIYLLDDSQKTLVLASGAGHVGRQMVSEGKQIDIHSLQSIVAEAARTHKGIIINDVTTSSTFMPNPLLPDTRSELAVPLIARGRLLGVLDVQSDRVNYFSDEALSVMDLMAGQIATAISNARLYEVAERTSRHERALGNIDRRIQGAVNMDDILQTAVRELGKALRMPYTAIELQLTASDHDDGK